MSIFESNTALSRRSMLALSGRLAGGLLAATSLTISDNAYASSPRFVPVSAPEKAADFDAISRIIQAQGKTDEGIFSIDIDRDDITNVMLHNVLIKPAFQINGTLYFQKLENGEYCMNADLPLKQDEMLPFLDHLLKHDIVFQAQHQHFYDFEPMVWFVHFRKVGPAEQLARDVKAALNVTATPFPQTRPSHPTTPLPADEIGNILGGSASISSDGVVEVHVPRAEQITLGGVRISPFLNVSTAIPFQPLDSTGKMAAAAPDFGMVASEVQPLIGLMRRQGWDIGCLYNQETDEQPQLFFSHQFKTGDPIILAHEIRRGLDRMHMKFKS